MPYIEIKTRERIDRGLALHIIAKGTIKAIITTGVISANAKKLFEDNGISYAENIPESEFINFNLEEM